MTNNYYISRMEDLKVDISKLYSIQEYANMMGVERQTVYNWIKDTDKALKVITISGKKFIKL